MRAREPVGDGLTSLERRGDSFSSVMKERTGGWKGMVFITAPWGPVGNHQAQGNGDWRRK